MTYWKLKLLHKNGHVTEVTGSEDVLRNALDEIEEALRAGEGMGAKVLRINAFCDTYDRAELAVAVRVDSIDAANLLRWS